MTAGECEACPFPDQTAALELVRLREGIGRLASEWDCPHDVAGCERCWQDPERNLPAADKLRALLDDNEGERS